ncbi:uncharacterized protein LOC143461930 isoform X3 [Clavelina lepadiformis]|uniref:uncharacterized protein LOC143461930 isoform X2 n=1 Tax=Clavelina lepadiformis TaxID=159417 RepID=UPI00404311C1
MANNTQQLVTVTTTHPANEIKNKRIIFGLGVAEVILGAISIVLGAVLCGQFGCSTVLGESIWCGIWFIVAGALGIAAGGESAGVGLINAHMGFSIWGSVAAGSMVFVSGVYASLYPTVVQAQYSQEFNSINADFLGTVVPVLSVSAVVGFIAFILLIVSAAYCCCSTPYNCCSCCCAQSYPAQPPAMQNVYTQQTFVAAPADNQAALYPPPYLTQANQPIHAGPGQYAPLYTKS